MMTTEMTAVRSPILAGILLALLAVLPASAEISAFVATVGFDEEASLDRGPGIGLRWGKAGGLLGGETSLLIARPERAVGTSKESATALFYEGRVLVNIPVGQIKPFVGVGFGAVTITGTDVELPTGADEAVSQALNTVADLQTSTALSYGGGVRYALNERLDLRFDLRQYLVFSVKGIAADQLQEQLEDQTGQDIPDLTKNRTVRHNELSLGICAKF